MGMSQTGLLGSIRQHTPRSLLGTKHQTNHKYGTKVVRTRDNHVFAFPAHSCLQLAGPPVARLNKRELSTRIMQVMLDRAPVLCADRRLFQHLHSRPSGPKTTSSETVPTVDWGAGSGAGPARGTPSRQSCARSKR